MHELIKAAREQAGFTQGQAARKLFMSISNYWRYENGELPLTTDLVVKMAKLFNCPRLTAAWCRQGCAIGRKDRYEILNNVDLNPTAILSKYRQEEREAHEAMDAMLDIVLNKKDASDCTEQELRDLWHCAQEMLDLAHVIETLKLRLWDFLNVTELVDEHNRKVRERRYYDPKKAVMNLASRGEKSA